MASILDDVLTIVSGAFGQDTKKSVMDPTYAKDKALREVVPAFTAGIVKSMDPREDPSNIMPLVGSLIFGSSEAEALVGSAARVKGLKSAFEAAKMVGKDVSNKEVWEKTGVYKGPIDKQLKAVISDQGAKLKQKWISTNQETTLGEMLDHPEFFKAYPELASTKIKGREFDGRAAFDPANSTIYVNPQAYFKNEQDYLGVLLHEVQHNIQKEEGFISGANQAMAKKSSYFSRGLTDQETMSELGLEKIVTKDPRAITDILADKIYKLQAGEAEARYVQEALERKDWTSLPTELYDVDPNAVVDLRKP